MFFDPILAIQLDGMDILDYTKIYDMSIYASIDSTLPELTFKMRDTDGRMLTSMQLYIGQIVNVIVRDTSRDAEITAKESDSIQPEISFCSFAINRLYDGLEAGNGHSGFIQVWCTQSWKIYGNYKPKIYSPQKNSQIITDVCKNANIMANIKVKEEYIDTSSDEGITPRYKCSESDIEFLERKVLPYTNIDESNVLFFVDQFGFAHLTSFDKIKYSDEKAIIRAADTEMSSIAEKVKKLKEDKGIEAYGYTSIKVNIGDDSICNKVGLLKEKVIIHHNDTGKVYMGTQKLSAKMGPGGTTTFQNATPLSSVNMAILSATGCNVIENRIFGDAVSYASNDEANFEDMFIVNVQVSNILNEIVPGNTVQLVPPIVDTSDMEDPDLAAKDTSWLDGKWVVKSIQFNQKEKGIFSTSLELIRPTFIFNTSSTTIDRPERFYLI